MAQLGHWLVEHLGEKWADAGGGGVGGGVGDGGETRNYGAGHHRSGNEEHATGRPAEPDEEWRREIIKSDKLIESVSPSGKHAKRRKEIKNALDTLLAPSARQPVKSQSQVTVVAQALARFFYFFYQNHFYN